jgi:hypothetical protein
VSLVFEKLFFVRTALMEGLIAFGHSLASFAIRSRSDDPAVVAGRRDHRCAARPYGNDGRGAHDHAHDQDAVEPGAAGADLHLRRRDLRRLALGDPAQHPGHAASAASCLDGHALAKQGLAGRAMGIATSGSVLGTLIGMVFLAWFTPILGDLALKFGAYEFFWLAVFGVIIAGTLTGTIRSRAGSQVCSASSRVRRPGSDLRVRPLQLRQPRPGGRLQPRAGARRRVRFRRAPVCGARAPAPVKINPFDSVIPKLVDVTRYWRTIVRSGLIGTFIGILPGVGEDVARGRRMRRRSARARKPTSSARARSRA